MNVKTSMRDIRALAKALARVGAPHGVKWTESQIEVHENGGVLNGYGGTKLTAHVIIRKQHAGGLGDIGYVKNSDGTLSLVVDDYDKAGKLGLDGKGYGDEWQGKVSAFYGCEKAKREMITRGIKYAEKTDAQGHPQLVAILA
jgi:hypothetical protein